jgi:manganese/zinc/iron transport system permease protein
LSPGAWITIVAGLVATGCALLGSFLVVRRQALLTDAVSHAVLPGIVVAWLATGSRAPLAMIIGAGAFAVLCVLLVEALESTGLVRTDGAIGLVFPALFSLGVLGVHRWTEDIHLDLDATIYGEIAFIGFDQLTLFGGVDVPRAAVVTGAVVLVDLLLVVLGWRVLRAASFDPGFSASVGVPVRLVSRLLLLATAMTAVVAFDAVGAILVITLFIVPAATGMAVARSMLGVVVVAVASGWIAAILGWQVALRWDASIAGVMGVVAGMAFVLGIAVRVMRRRLGSRRAVGVRP